LATFDDLFGKKGKYIQWRAEGETLIFQLLGEPDGSWPQRDFKSGERKFMVETEEKSRSSIRLRLRRRSLASSLSPRS